MLDVQHYYCVNAECAVYGLRGKGNIVRCGTYGKHKRQLLQCNVCKQRFSETRNTAFFGSKYSAETIQMIIRCVVEGNGVRSTARILDLSKDGVNHVIKKAGQHCDAVLSNLLQSLQLDQCQLDELFTFIQKKELFMRPTRRADAGEYGSG
jgi:transposase-like protein